MALTRLKKHKFIPYINVSTTSTPSWARIGKSTIFDLTLNANIVTSDFIEDEMPTDDVTYYKPTLPQELQTNAGDASFDFIYGMFKSLPTGEDIKKDVLLVFAGASSPFDAWLTNSSVILKDLNSVDEKILFDLNINSITQGTVVIDADTGVPTFTPAS
jgi:hypothetical protein